MTDVIAGLDAQQLGYPSSLGNDRVTTRATSPVWGSTRALNGQAESNGSCTTS